MSENENICKSVHKPSFLYSLIFEDYRCPDCDTCFRESRRSRVARVVGIVLSIVVGRVLPTLANWQWSFIPPNYGYHHHAGIEHYLMVLLYLLLGLILYQFGNYEPVKKGDC